MTNKTSSTTSIGLETEVQELSLLLEKMIENQKREGDNPDEWLRLLHQSYSARFLADNERIWTVGSILIPVSLAGFAAFISIDAPRLWHVVILGFSSISLMLIWNLIAEKHREFQDHSQNWIKAIEGIIKLTKARKPKVTTGDKKSKITLRTMRWSLLGLVILAWVSIFISIRLGIIGTPDPNASSAALSPTSLPPATVTLIPTTINITATQTVSPPIQITPIP